MNVKPGHGLNVRLGQEANGSRRNPKRSASLAKVPSKSERRAKALPALADGAVAAEPGGVVAANVAVKTATSKPARKRAARPRSKDRERSGGHGSSGPRPTVAKVARGARVLPAPRVEAEVAKGADAARARAKAKADVRTKAKGIASSGAEARRAEAVRSAEAAPGRIGRSVRTARKGAPGSGPSVFTMSLPLRPRLIRSSAG